MDIGRESCLFVAGLPCHEAAALDLGCAGHDPEVRVDRRAPCFHQEGCLDEEDRRRAIKDGIRAMTRLAISARMRGWVICSS